MNDDVRGSPQTPDPGDTVTEVRREPAPVPERRGSPLIGTLRNVMLGLLALAVLGAGLGIWLSGDRREAADTGTAAADATTPATPDGNGTTGTAPVGATPGTPTGAQTDGPAAPQEVAQVTQPAYDVDSPKALYEAACASCHMPDGRGAVGAARYPALANNPRLAQYQYPATFIMNGAGAMPTFQRHLTDQQVADVINYVRTELNDYTDTVDAGMIAPFRRPTPTPDIDGAAG